MAPRRKIRQREAQLAFEALSIEGGLISPEWLARVAQLDAGHQAEADYRIPKGLNLRDEIGRYWRMAQAHWSDFARAWAAGSANRLFTEQFVTALLKDCLGFASLAARSPVDVGDRTYPLAWGALEGRVPVVIVAPRPPDGKDAGSALDDLSSELGDAGRRRSAFGLAQEYLNAEEDALWALVCDGLTLRLCRDNASLTRPAWIEADLDRIFREERYSDFAALWLLAHETRFGAPGQLVSDCHLETWRAAGREEGTRAREFLRDGVEAAIVALGKGFLANAENQSLRTALHDGTLSPNDYFQELLRLVYRIIFLLTAEERGVLHPAGVTDEVKARYALGYGLRRLRDRAVKRSAHDRFSDLWEGLKIVLRGVAAGEPRLGLPPLGGLFAPSQCPHLDAARLENRALLTAVFRLSWLKGDAGLARVNWRDMGPEELGSVYESLLELVPVIPPDHRGFSFATGDETKGTARKTTGSYYTPDALVQAILECSLEPAIRAAAAAHPEAPAEAVLALTVIDPACGSGHFLLAAARRLADHVARLRANGTPSVADCRSAMRQVVGHCIFGVDRNPMAIELARVALWLEAMTSDAPLSFVDHHLVCGDALLGLIDLNVLKAGIPPDAFEPSEGDDPDVARRLGKRNRVGQKRLQEDAKSGQQALPFIDTAFARRMQTLEDMPDGSISAVEAKRAAFRSVKDEGLNADTHPLALASDMVVAAYMSPKTATCEESVPTTSDLRSLLNGTPISPSIAMGSRSVARGVKALHWHLEFPQVFACGGFDVVIGNPPWDSLSPDVKEFFSQWNTAVRFQSLGEQKNTVEQLLEDQRVRQAWEGYCRTLYNSVAFMKSSGRYRLFSPGNLGKGDFNVYRMFIETALSIVRPGGWASQLVPEGLYNGANCMMIRQELFQHCSLHRIVGLENSRRVWFDSVDTRAKFAFYAAEIPGRTEVFRAAFCVRSQQELSAATGGEALEMSVALVREFSPDALALMEFGTQRDIDIASKMYSRHPKFGDRPEGAPSVSCVAEIHMGNDRGLFLEQGEGLPLVEGRHIAQYDHCAKAYVEGRGRAAVWRDLSFGDSSKGLVTQWRVAASAVPEKLSGRQRRYRACFCKVTSPTNERTLIATIVPPNCLCGDSIPTVLFEEGSDWLGVLWTGIANTYVLDYIARKKTSLNLTFTVLDSLPFPQFSSSDQRAHFIVSRVARLVCTTPEMRDLWRTLEGGGWVQPQGIDRAVPGELDPELRERLTWELDAFVAGEVFGLTRDELSFVLETFPIVKRRDEERYGEYRTKVAILGIYDAMAEAIRTGKPYQTRLDPPPADPRVAHPAASGRKGARS